MGKPLLRGLVITSLAVASVSHLVPAHAAEAATTLGPGLRWYLSASAGSLGPGQAAGGGSTTTTPPPPQATNANAGAESAQSPGAAGQAAPSALVANGASLFRQNCAFCHGRDAGGGETGPDLTRSKLVSEDVAGNKISDVVHNGRTEKGMPRFNFSEPEMAGLVAFIHSQTTKALAMAGKRRGVDVSDLQTGNAEAGKAYFNGAGGCASCHSPTGDLAGIASRFQGLQLEERMLYPKDAKSTVTVTLPSGQSIHGTLAYLDEFTVALKDETGQYRSWPRISVKDRIESPVDAHVELFSKYTDDDIHNLMAYMQTLR